MPPMAAPAARHRGRMPVPVALRASRKPGSTWIASSTRLPPSRKPSRRHHPWRHCHLWRKSVPRRSSRSRGPRKLPLGANRARRGSRASPIPAAPELLPGATRAGRGSPASPIRVAPMPATGAIRLDGTAAGVAADTAAAGGDKPPGFAAGPRYNAGSQQGEAVMPEVYVHAVKGRSQEQKKALITDITNAVMKHFNAPADAVVVSIIETEANSKAKGGVLFSERGR